MTMEGVPAQPCWATLPSLGRPRIPSSAATPSTAAPCPSTVLAQVIPPVAPFDTSGARAELCHGHPNPSPALCPCRLSCFQQISSVAEKRKIPKENGGPKPQGAPQLHP